MPVAADLTAEEGLAAALEAAGDRIDGLANIAGIMDGLVPLHETEDALWERVLGVNLGAVFPLSRAVIGRMRETGGGAVVNVASEAALRGNAAGAACTVSKHGVVGLTEHAAFFYLADGIRVNAVAPGPTATGIEGSLRSELAGQRLGPFLQMIPPVASAAGAVHPEVTTREVMLALPMAVAASAGYPGAGTDPAARRMLHRALFTAAPTAPGSLAPRHGRGPGEPAPPTPLP